MNVTAQQMEAATPLTRVRYLDFLRVFAIAAVVYGHWLMAVVVVRDGALVANNVLEDISAVQYLTWAFQVMPLFFIVGGWVNGASWRSATGRGDSYGSWLMARIRRLVVPTAVFAAVWSVAGVALSSAGIFDDSITTLAAHVVAVPLWFLAVYIAVVALVPVTMALHQRWGIVVPIALLAAAGVVDLVVGVFPAVGWVNFLFVWTAVHQLGYVWRDGGLSQPGTARGLAVLGAGTLIALTTYGPYPVSMVGIPGADASNNAPPTVALGVLALTQLGVAAWMRRPIEAWLHRPRVWLVVVALNRMAMTVFLWHLTAMVLVIGALFATGSALLTPEALTASWWLTRPLWFAVMTIALAPFVLALKRFEAGGPSQAPTALALIASALAVFGFAGLALDGFLGGPAWSGGLHVFGVATVFASAMLAVSRRTTSPGRGVELAVRPTADGIHRRYDATRTGR